MSFFKVLVIGDVGVGKTSLVNRIVYNTFTEKYKATIGCEFGLKIIEINGEPVRVQLWDLAGQDRLGGISRLYCRDANGALVVTDATREGTLEQASLWKGSVDDNVRLPDGSPIPMVLVANKSDLLVPGSGMTNDDLARFANQRQFVASYMTSSKLGTNANEALVRLVEEIMKRSQAKEDAMESQIKGMGGEKLKAGKQHTQQKKCC
ncbi:unnamed protein product [Blepharisma stoltei]|uniref:Uncharacterized protein n=1 Tax=Blepharisma stoltei TaxID=1481888 RepID=A0AAU9I7E8_9CILI|nr:unnamed protein product [Blepharisma stoltei]